MMMDIKNIMDCQEMFFHWAMDNGYMLERLKDNNNTYEFSSTRYAFQGYKAGYESQQAEITRLTAIIEEMKQVDDVLAPSNYDKKLLDSRMICIKTRNEFGETENTIHVGLDLRKAIDEAMRKDK